jgi:hypothetical protein
MFWKKKQPVIHPTFGEVSYSKPYWEPKEKTEFSLFGKTYQVDVSLYAGFENEPISKMHEETFRKFQDVMVSEKSRIEEEIVSYLKTVSSYDDFAVRYKENYDTSDYVTRFLPFVLRINTQGECALGVEDDAEAYGKYDDWASGFVVSLFPELEVNSTESYSGTLYF